MLGVFGLIGLVCAVWVIYDVWSEQKSLSDAEKIAWTIGAVVLNVITAILYYFFVKRKK